MRNIIMVLSLSVVIAGCASSEFTRMGRDTFSIKKQSFSTYSSADEVKDDLNKEGSEYCSDIGKVFLPINSKGEDGVRGLTYSNAEIQFRCLSKGDPELIRTKNKPVANVKTENDAQRKKEFIASDPRDMNKEVKK